MNGASRVIDENGQLQENCFQIGDQGSAARPAIAEPTVVSPPAMPAPVAAAPIAAPDPSAPPDLIKLARERRNWLRGEVKRLRVLEKELGEIERLLAAAKTKPRAAVRDISSSSRRAI